MYDICHPTYYNMSQLGCNDQVKLTTAFYVYMELCEVRRYWDVEYKYMPSLELFCLGARKSKNAKVEMFIPWPTFHNLTLDLISNIQQELKKDKFTFVFKEGDTSSVHYSICSDIVKPTPVEEANLFKQKEKKKFFLEKEIKRNTSNLYNRALSLGKKCDKSNKSGTKEIGDKEKFYTSKHYNEKTKLEKSTSSNNSVQHEDTESVEDGYNPYTEWEL